MRKSITSTRREAILPPCSAMLNAVVCGPELGPRETELLQQGQLKFKEISKGLEHFLHEERL